MDLEQLAQKFDTYHAEAKTFGTSIKSLGERLDAERKEREELEIRMSRHGFRRGDADPAAELKAVGEGFRAFIKSGNFQPLQEICTKAGMSVGSDPDGGYFVYPQISTAVTKKIFEISPIRQVARIVPIGTDAFEEPLDLNEPDAGWVAELGARTDTAHPQVGKLRIPVHEIYAMPKVSQKLLDDSELDLGEWLTQKISARFGRLEGTAFCTGNGVGQPRGIFDYGAASVTTGDATRAWGVLQYIPTGGASDFAASAPADALIDAQTALKAEYRRNAVWLMNRRTAGKVRKFKDGQNNYLWTPSVMAGQPDMLLGHPVVLCDDIADVGSNAYVAAFGDFSQGYTIAERHGMRLMRDPYTDKPNVRFYSYMRVGGDVTNFEAIKLVKCATS